MFVALFIVNFLDYIKKVQQNNYVEWDVKTVTAGDFTIEFDVDPGFFNDYKRNFKDAWVAKNAAEGRTFGSDVLGF